MKKSVLVTLIILTLIFSCFTVNAAENSEEIKININGEDILFNNGIKPFIENGTTLVPVRIVTENFGAKVEWNGKLQEVYILKDKLNLKIYINKTETFVNDQVAKVNVAPKLINSTTYVPLRFIGENMGLNIIWNNENRTVYITEKEIEEQQEVNEEIEGDFFKYKNNVLYYVEDSKEIDTLTNSTYMNREELNYYFNTVYDFAKTNDLYFTIRFSEDSSTLTLIAALSKENLEDLNKSAYISVNFTNNGELEGMDQIGKNISIITDNLTNKASYLKKINVKPYLELSEKLIKYFAKNKYKEQLYKDFKEFQENKSYADTNNSQYYGPIKLKTYNVNDVKISVSSAGGYMVRYNLYVK